MKQEITLVDCIGRTVKGVAESYCGPYLIITFTDDTFTMLGIKRGYDPCDNEIVSEELALFDFGDSALVDAEIVTWEELESLRADRDAKRKSEWADRELAEYNRLAMKYSKP